MSTLPNPLFIFIPALMWLILGPLFIRYLRRQTIEQYIREEGPSHHQQKQGTPTMGGVLIIFTVLLSYIAFLLRSPGLLSPAVIGVLGALTLLGCLGFTDDYLKVAKKQNKGVTGWTKLTIQGITGLSIGYGSMKLFGSSVDVFGLAVVNLGWLYPVFAMLIITGASNAYNLTDGLDGLSSSTGFMTFVGFAFILTGQPDLMLVALLLAGGCLGFLWYNKHPAQIFMGDTGSLALGGAMGALAVLSKSELFLLLLGGIYVIETLSVMIQVTYFKLTKGKRLFRMSPLHHHFELGGWSETKVVFVFAMVQLVLSVAGVFLYNRI